MANATANSINIQPVTKRTVTTVEHFEWDAEEGSWKPVSKHVTTEDAPAPEPAYPLSPWVNPWPGQPHQPYYPPYRATFQGGIQPC